MTHETVVVPDIEIVVPARTELGEGPVTGAGGRVLHWVDIFTGTVATTDLDDGSTRRITVDTLVGAVAPRRTGGFVAAVREGFATIDDDGALTVTHPLLAPGHRMNDAASDPAGRFWAGSLAMDFAAGQGALHVLLPGGGTRQVLTGLTQPNGLGWSPDGTTFYLVDTVLRTLTAWDFDPATGDLNSGRVILELPGSDRSFGLPDGLAVDADGDLWIAMWGGSQLLRVSPSGAVRDRIALPVTQPTSCAFAGPDLDVLLVTSAAQGLAGTGDDVPGRPEGALLAIRGLGVRGLASVPFDG